MNPIVETEFENGTQKDKIIEELLFVARCSLADLEGIMPRFEPNGDRCHPGWRTIEELKVAIKIAEEFTKGEQQ